MVFDKEKIEDISAIYRYIYKYDEKGEGVHRNTLKKHLLQDGKISSKARYNAALESLIALGKVKMKRENVSLSSSLSNVGLLQKLNHYYVVVQDSNKRYPVDKRFAQGYKTGDVLDVVVDQFGKDTQVIILGKSQKEFKAEGQKRRYTTPLFQFPDPEKDNKVLGRVVKVSHDKLVFIPNNKSIPLRHIEILNDKEECSKFQDKICVMELVDRDVPYTGGMIIEVKGDAGNPIHEYDAIAENYGAIMHWDDPELQKEIDNIPSFVDTKNLNLITENEANSGQDGIVDLRHLPFVTIDPADCKDMDDAIYSTVDENGNYVCYTAVANVTKYVDLYSRIGQNYINGGFTIYAPNKAYNILPTKLSTGICSLNPHEDRLAYVVKTTIDKNTGEAMSSQIYDSIIASQQKYSYEQAQAINDSIINEVPLETLKLKVQNGEKLSADEQILMSYYSAQAIKLGFKNRQMIRFNSNDERNIVFNDDMSDIIDISQTEPLEFHEVIEAFMITANEASAKFTKDNNIDTIYRVHDKPNARKASRSKEFFSLLGLYLNEDYSPTTMNNLINLIKGSDNEEMVNKFLIRMQSRAVYSDKLYNSNERTIDNENPISHYALQSPHYSHTTAPIRRITDYVTHYNILAKLHGTKPLNKNEIDDIIEIANNRQLDVDQAEKDFSDISSVIYCEKHIGEKFKGSIIKFRPAVMSEGFEDEIVVVVKNDETGIAAEIPLSQVIGPKAKTCRISKQCCAIFDERGKTVLTICKPLDFIVEKADRKSMTVVGKTNKALMNEAKERVQSARKFFKGKNGYINANKPLVKPVNMETPANMEAPADESTNENISELE